MVEMLKVAPEKKMVQRENGAKTSPSSYDIRDEVDALDRIRTIIDS
jgi:hypothetical protein